MKRIYISPDVEIHCLDVSYSILDASKTGRRIEISDDVRVQDYSQGFGSSPANDFQEISFD